MSPRASGRTVPLRRRLLLLAGVGIVPLAVLSGLGLYALAHQQRLQAERVGLELTRAVAVAVDAELRTSVAVLETLTTSLALDQQDLAAFRERAQRVLGTQAHWAALTLTTPAGARILDTRYGHDVRSLAPDERPSFEHVVRTRQPAVGSLTEGHDDTLVFRCERPCFATGSSATCSPPS